MPIKIEQVKPGIFASHHSGGVYRVLHIANNSVPETDKFPRCVVYQSIESGAVWSRPIRDFAQNFDLVFLPAGWLTRLRRAAIRFFQGRGGGKNIVISGEISNSTIIQGDVRGWK